MRKEDMIWSCSLTQDDGASASLSAASIRDPGYSGRKKNMKEREGFYEPDLELW